MVNTVTPAAGGQHGQQRPSDPAPSRLVAFLCVLGLYLGFAGVLIGLGYGLWPAIAGAATACVVAGEVARRVITAGTTPGGDLTVTSSGLPELLRDIIRVADRGSPLGGPGDGGRKEI
jgi:hypothetical protein